MNSGKSLFLDGYMALFCNFYVWIPFLLSILYLLIKNNSIQDFLEILLLNCCMLLVVYLLTSYAIMPVTEYLLSWCYDLPADVYNIEKWGSPFLLQIASTTAISIFLSIIIRHGTLSFSFILWCLLSCVSCMYFAAGGLLEIVASLFTGIICGTLTYRVHRYIQGKRRNGRRDWISDRFTATGYDVSDIYFVLVVMYTTFAIIPVISFYL